MFEYGLLLILFNFATCSVIIPEELPSLLSVAYSNIPPIKKGTDSRVGFGFAFGNHADFQVMFELGPQTNTNPIGQAYPTNTKRQALIAATKSNKNRDKFYESDSGNFLLNWAQKMKKPLRNTPKPPMDLQDAVVELVKNEKGEYEIHQPSPKIPSKMLQELKKLYGEKKSEVEKLEVKKRGEVKTRGEEEVKKITEDLSNVDLD